MGNHFARKIIGTEISDNESLYTYVKLVNALLKDMADETRTVAGELRTNLALIPSTDELSSAARAKQIVDPLIMAAGMLDDAATQVKATTIRFQQHMRNEISAARKKAKSSFKVTGD